MHWFRDSLPIPRRCPIRVCAFRSQSTPPSLRNRLHRTSAADNSNHPQYNQECQIKKCSSLGLSDYCLSSTHYLMCHLHHIVCIRWCSHTIRGIVELLASR